MIVEKLWRAVAAQINKLANLFWTADPIAQMQYEYDQAVEEMKSGRTGLEQYRALVERCSRQVARDETHVKNLEAKVKAYLQTGDRETAAKFALELKKAQGELAQNEQQLAMHEKSYENNLLKIKHASSKLVSVREKIQKYDAELKMSRAEAEIAKKFGDASEHYRDDPTALHLRAMNMVFEGLKQKGAMVIVPSTAVETMGLGGLGGLTAFDRMQSMASREQAEPSEPAPSGPLPEGGEAPDAH